MGFFDDLVSNTVGSAKAVLSDPIAQAGATFGINPTALPVYQATGITPLNQAAIGAAVGGAVAAAPVVAAAIPSGSAAAGSAALAGVTTAADGLKKQPDPAPAAAAPAAEKSDSNGLMYLGLGAIAVKLLLF